jgi:hypothetical protein
MADIVDTLDTVYPTHPIVQDAKREIESLRETVDLLDRNHRVQAKLLAEIGRERDAARAQVEGMAGKGIPIRNEQIIHGAVDRGNAKYWIDHRRQEEAFKKWEAAGYEGDCRQCLNGSVVDYITRSIMNLSEPAKKMLEGAPALPSTERTAP